MVISKILTWRFVAKYTSSDAQTVSNPQYEQHDQPVHSPIGQQVFELVRGQLLSSLLPFNSMHREERRSDGTGKGSLDAIVRRSIKVQIGKFYINCGCIGIVDFTGTLVLGDLGTG